MVSEQKYPDNLLFVAATFFFWFIKVSNVFLCSLGLTEASFEVLTNSFKFFKTSLSSSSNPSDMLTLLEEFCKTDVSGGLYQVRCMGMVGSQQKNYLQQA